jgi:hypothetical protein
MNDLQQRILRGIERIMKARERGWDTSDWENHLIGLINELAQGNTVTVKMGRYGFCTCPLNSGRHGRGLCCGCFKVSSACACKKLEVNPADEINQQYLQYIKGIKPH